VISEVYDLNRIKFDNFHVAPGIYVCVSAM